MAYQLQLYRARKKAEAGTKTNVVIPAGITLPETDQPQPPPPPAPPPVPVVETTTAEPSAGLVRLPEPKQVGGVTVSWMFRLSGAVPRYCRLRAYPAPLACFTPKNGAISGLS
jgi:hypothetical protein